MRNRPGALRSHAQRSFVSSFDWDSLREARRLDPRRPDLPSARSLDDALLAVAAELGSPASPSPRRYDRFGGADRCGKRAGGRVWTVNDGEAFGSATRAAIVMTTSRPRSDALGAG
jgi:hypothetical protein